MENKKGYIVLEVGFEYDDQYYSTGNYGAMYEKPSKLFLDKEKAIVFCKKESIKKLSGLYLGLYSEEGVDSLIKSGMMEKFDQIMEELGLDKDDFQIPTTATYEQLEQIFDCLKIEFFKVAEIEIE